MDVLAARSMFGGFVSSGGDNAVLNRLIADNRLIAEYGKACRDELKYGCAFATLSADAAIGCKIRFHSPATAAALWPGGWWKAASRPGLRLPRRVSTPAAPF